MPIAIATPEMEPHRSPFKPTPAPIAVPILGISSELTPRYSAKANRTLSQQLYGRPAGKLLGLLQKYRTTLSCNSFTLFCLFSDIFTSQHISLIWLVRILSTVLIYKYVPQAYFPTKT
jgi:hypothetical protein